MVEEVEQNAPMNHRTAIMSVGERKGCIGVLEESMHTHNHNQQVHTYCTIYSIM